VSGGTTDTKQQSLFVTEDSSSSSYYYYNQEDSLLQSYGHNRSFSYQRIEVYYYNYNRLSWIAKTSSSGTSTHRRSVKLEEQEYIVRATIMTLYNSKYKKEQPPWQQLKLLLAARKKMFLLQLFVVIFFIQFLELRSFWFKARGVWLRSKIYDIRWVDAHISTATKDDEYDNTFRFSLKPSPECAKLLDDEATLKYMAFAAAQKQEMVKHPEKTYSSDQVSSILDRHDEAEAIWNKLMNACHGGPASLMYENENNQTAVVASLQSFHQGILSCALPQKRREGGLPDLFGGEWCNGYWHQYMNKHVSRHHQLQTLFVESVRCAMHLEFPLVAPKASKEDTNAVSEPCSLRQQKPIHWKPKRVILLALVLGPKGIDQASRLISTAYPRGWEIVLVQGPYRGLKYKYSDALLALKSVFEEPNAVPPQDTVILFADGSDVLVQQGPDEVINTFLDQSEEAFMFSAEPHCFPLGLFPHSIGVPHYVCGEEGGLYPTSSANAIVPNTRQYVNTGGWIALGNSALVVLKEFVEFEQQVRSDRGKRRCHDWGTDQLLGNAAYLKSSEIGLDAEYDIFASGAWGLINTTLHLVQQQRQMEHNPSSTLQHSKDEQNRYMYCNQDNHCPALLHFNGVASSGGTFDTAFAELTGDHHQACNAGRVLVVDQTTGKMKTLGKSSLRKILKGSKPCLG